MCGVEDSCVFFRIRITQCTRSFKLAGTTHCCQKLTFFGGWGVNVTFGLPAMDLKNVQMYEICSGVNSYLQLKSPPAHAHTLVSAHECYFCSLKF